MVMSEGMVMSEAISLQAHFTRFLLDAGALRFGDFTLKSGRRSPYFINAGAFDDGAKIALLGEFYARTVLAGITQGVLPKDIDTVFGPAYKGIPLAVSTAIALNGAHGMHVGYSFDRKERKDHGDGGDFVGTPIRDGLRVLLVDDVMTAGTAVREVMGKLQAAAPHVHVVGLVLAVDRMERAGGSSSEGAGGTGGRDAEGADLSAVRAVQQEFGFPVLSIVNVLQIFDAAASLTDSAGRPLLDAALRRRARRYLDKYGIR